MHVLPVCKIVVANSQITPRTEILLAATLVCVDDSSTGGGETKLPGSLLQTAAFIEVQQILIRKTHHSAYPALPGMDS